MAQKTEKTKERKSMSNKNENFSLSYAADRLTVSLLCEVDHHKAKPLREAIDHAVFAYRPKVLILDFSAVRFMDSSAIALILGRSALGEDFGFRIVLCGLSKTAQRLLRLSGLEARANVCVEGTKGGREK